MTRPGPRGLREDDLIAAYRAERGPSAQARDRLARRLNALGPPEGLPSHRGRVGLGVGVATSVGLVAAALLGWWAAGGPSMTHSGTSRDLAVDGVVSEPKPHTLDRRPVDQEPVWTEVEPAASELGASEAESPAALPSATRARPVGSPRTARDRSPLQQASLEEELARVGRARAEVARGRAAQALRILDAYDREFPGGALREEADAVRIMARCRSGDAEGRRVQRAFLRRHPRSLFRSQVLEACRTTAPERPGPERIDPNGG